MGMRMARGWLPLLATFGRGTQLFAKEFRRRTRVALYWKERRRHGARCRRAWRCCFVQPKICYISMAINCFPLLGQQRGKVGPVVGRVVDGVQIFSGYEPHVSNPRSAGQTAHRERFGTINRLSRTMAEAVNVGFRQVAMGRAMTSPRNLFVSANMEHVAYSEAEGATEVDYRALVVAAGRAPGVSFGSPRCEEERRLVVDFQTAEGNGGVGAMALDAVFLVALQAEADQCVVGKASRREGQVEAVWPQGWTGGVARVWGFVCSATTRTVRFDSVGLTLHRDECSPSVYLGEVLLA